MNEKKQRGATLGPVFTIMIFILVVILLSFLFSILGIDGSVNNVTNGSIEATIIKVNNVLSIDGLKYLFSSVISNLANFQALLFVIVSLIGIGIAEKSGLFKIILTPLINCKPRTITFWTIFAGVVASFFGEYSFALLIPLVGIFYKYAGRNSRLGIITAFIAMTMGYGTSLCFNNIDLSLGNAMQVIATLEVDKSYVFNLFSNLFILLGSTIIISIVGTIIVERTLAPKYPKRTPINDDDINVSSKGLLATGIILAVILALLIYAIIPNLPGSGLLLDSNATTYLESLFGDNSPFYNSFIFIITLILMICGYVYGRISRNIKSSNDYSVALAKGFEGTGYLFVLMFFMAELVGLVEYTNIGTIIASNLVNALSNASFSGAALIIVYFFMIIIMGIFIPSTTAKWNLIYPTTVPLFMRANITPSYTLFVFRAADGVAKAISPLFPYYVVMLAFLQKYNYDDDENKITIFGTFKNILPTLLLFTVLWLLILIGWYIIGLPIGPGTYPTL